MKFNNLYAKPIMKAVFFILVLMALVNLAFLLTNIQPFTDLAHISISVSLFIMSGIIMSKNMFIKYNSEDAVIEIERSGIFSGKNAIHSGQLGFIKLKVQDFHVAKTWYGMELTLVYSTSSGKSYSKAFPVLFATKKGCSDLANDLRVITNTPLEIESKASKVIPVKILKNSPAFS